MAARVHFHCSLVILVLCVVSLCAAPARAQLSLSDAGNALSITFSPITPNPGDTVLVSVRSSLIDISESDILWQANGHTIAQGKGVDAASVQAGALGVEMRIDASVTPPGGVTAVAHATMIPTELDLLVDADSYTPPFYRGRPRASAGTNLHLQALPRFKRAGVFLPASALTYTWRRNDEVLGNISGRGRSTAIIPVEHLFGTDSISVEARSSDGLLSHISSFSLKAEEPLLVLYEDHPLYGVLYHRALSASTFIPETEMTFSAAPFFAQAASVYDPALNFLWHVNAKEIPPHSTDPSELTINAENSSGVAFVELEVTHATNYYLSAKGAWNITFSADTNSSDQFHQSKSVNQ